MNRDLCEFRHKWRTPVLFFIGVIMFQQQLLSSTNLRSNLDDDLNKFTNANEWDFPMQILYLIPNCIIPLALGYCTDYLAESSSLLYFVINIIIAYIFQQVTSIDNNSLEIQVIFTLILSITGESLVIPLYLFIERWFGHMKSSQGLCWLMCFSFAGSILKSVLRSRMISHNTLGSSKIQSSLDIDDELYSRLNLGGYIISLVLVISLKLLHGTLSRLCNLHLSSRIFTIGFPKALKSLVNRRFFLLCIHSASIYSSFFITYHFYNKSITNYWAPADFYKLFCIVYSIAILIHLFLGKYLDNHGTRTSVLAVSSLFYIFSYLCLSLIYNSNHASDSTVNLLVILALLLIGVGYGLHFGTVLSILPCLFERQILGTAYGFMISFNSTLTVVVYFICKSMVFNIHLLSLFFAFIGFVSIILIEIIEQNQVVVLGKRKPPQESLGETAIF